MGTCVLLTILLGDSAVPVAVGADDSQAARRHGREEPIAERPRVAAVVPEVAR